jgi:hypothetical protein
MGLNVASGTLQITGSNITVSSLSFQPKLLLLWSIGANTSGSDNVAGSKDIVRSFGACDGTNQFCYSMYERNGGTGGTNTYCYLTAAACMVFNAGSSNTGVDPHGEYSFGSFNSNGFTLNVNASGTPVYAAQVCYLALGGSDITATAIGTTSLAAGATGNTSVTGLGFQPTSLIAVAGNQDSTTNGAYVGPYNGSLSVGFFDGVNQFVSSVFCDGQVLSTQQNRHYARGDELYCTIYQGYTSSTPSAAVRGKAVSLDSGGFTIDQLANSSGTNATELAYIAIGGIACAVGNLLTETNTTTDMSVSGLSFAPAAGLLLSVNDAEATAGTVQTGGTPMSLGCFTSTTSRAATAANSADNASPTTCFSAVAFDRVYLNVEPSSAALQGAMDIVSVGSSGFTTVQPMNRVRLPFQIILRK